LIGARLVRVERGEHEWSFVFADDTALTVECLWRIRVGGSVARTRDDDGQWFGLAAPVDAEREAQELLPGDVRSVRLDEGSGDLVIEFGEGVVLEVLSNSAGYEAWQLHRGDAMLLVCQGGGRVVEMGG
jgi:hypothetical protein